MLDILSSMSDCSNALGPYLSRTRKELKLSLRAVDAQTGVSNAYLSQLENGKIKTPSPKVLHSLALKYGLPYEQLMELAGYPIPGKSQNQPSSSRLAARLGETSEEEEEALADFLALIRKRNGSEL